MEKVILNTIIRHDKEETEVEFTVRGRRVIGLFPIQDNTGVFQRIKNALIDTCIKRDFGENKRFFDLKSEV